MKITALIENTSNSPELACEHGLSLYLETKDRRILFDMGQSNAFLKNADKLNIDLSEADFAVVSHGHYDHGGGLPHFLKINKHAPVYIHSEAFYPFYSSMHKYIGLNEKLLEHSSIILTHEQTQIADNIALETKNTQKRNFSMPKQNTKFFCGKELKPDEFWHEQYMTVEENGRKFLITGCSHKGILNLLEWFQPNCVIGGFHLSHYDLNNPEDKNELKTIAEKMTEYATVFYTGHCTGKKQFEFLHAILGSQISYLSTGQQINI